MHKLGQAIRWHAPLSAFGVLTLAVGVVGALSLADNRELITWSFTHWAFSYNYGFVKRGLVGELLSQAIEPPSLFRTVWVASLLSAVVVAAALLYFFLRPFVQFRQPGHLALAVVTATHSALSSTSSTISAASTISGFCSRFCVSSASIDAVVVSVASSS